MQAEKPRIGFAGMGGMGSRMAARLVNAGFAVGVYNRTREKTREISERGAKVFATPKELAASSDVVMSSLTDDEAVESFLLGPEGALQAARPGMVFIDLSTIFQGTAEKLSYLVKANCSSGTDVRR